MDARGTDLRFLVAGAFLVVAVEACGDGGSGGGKGGAGATGGTGVAGAGGGRGGDEGSAAGTDGASAGIGGGAGTGGASAGIGGGAGTGGASAGSGGGAGTGGASAGSGGGAGTGGASAGSGGAGTGGGSAGTGGTAATAGTGGAGGSGGSAGTGGSAGASGGVGGSGGAGGCMVGMHCTASTCTSLGQAAIDGVSAAVVPFGGGSTFPSGCYRIVYVAGSHLHIQVPRSQYSTDTYFYSGATRIGQKGIYFQASPAVAEAGTANTQIEFVHCGGTIGVGSADSDFTDNRNGTPNPTWQLFSCVP